MDHSHDLHYLARASTWNSLAVRIKLRPPRHGKLPPHPATAHNPEPVGEAPGLHIITNHTVELPSPLRAFIRHSQQQQILTAQMSVPTTARRTQGNLPVWGPLQSHPTIAKACCYVQNEPCTSQFIHSGWFPYHQDQLLLLLLLLGHPLQLLHLLLQTPEPKAPVEPLLLNGFISY